LCDLLTYLLERINDKLLSQQKQNISRTLCERISCELFSVDEHFISFKFY